MPNPNRRRGDRWLLSVSKHVRPYAHQPIPRTLIAAPGRLANYEHIIRIEKEYERIAWYIENNPLNWMLDEEYVGE
jgi:hypothetical protein